MTLGSVEPLTRVEGHLESSKCIQMLGLSIASMILSVRGVPGCLRVVVAWKLLLTRTGCGERRSEVRELAGPLPIWRQP